MVVHALTQFHENAAAIDWWRRHLCRLLLWLTPPARRRALLAIAALWVGIDATLALLAKHKALPIPGDSLGAGLVVIAQFALLWVVYRAAANFSSLPAAMRRHPVLALHSSYWALLAVLWLTPPSAGLWRSVLFALAILYPLLLWRCSYMLLAGQYGRMAGTGFADHLFYLWPAYGGAHTPYGKGFAYLSQREAKTTEELARAQLAGIKLLILALVWCLVLSVYNGIFYGPGNELTQVVGGYTLGVPKMASMLELGGKAPVGLAWASIYGELFERVLKLAIKGHIIVGVLRLCGFNVFRNTYKPLLAESIVEFWNRYYYYFKELLANFFFLPTFAGLGKALRKWPNLRLFASVFAAAFVGNLYYHVIQDSASLAEGLVYRSLSGHKSHAFYCLLLSTGIFVSMLREKNRRGVSPDSRRAPRLVRIVSVWTFFGLIFIWNAGGDATFLTRVYFFLGLFGLA